MSQRGRQGRQIWRRRRDTLATEIADQITAASSEQMRTWATNGRVPWWIRIKTRLQRRPIDLRDGGQAR
jgi:hypothetical protein